MSLALCVIRDTDDSKIVAIREWIVILWFFEGIGKSGKQIASSLMGNASVHTAKKLKPYWELLAENGMQFYFLQPYSPKLNRIEMLWRKMK